MRGEKRDLERVREERGRQEDAERAKRGRCGD